MKNKPPFLAVALGCLVALGTLAAVAKAANLNIQWAPRPTAEAVTGYYYRWTTNYNNVTTNWGPWVSSGLGTNVDLVLDPGSYLFQGVASNAWGLGALGPVTQLPTVPGPISVKVTITFSAP